jgi:hypothetical protein
LQETVIPMAIAMGESGLDVSSLLRTAVPPPSISEAHEQIVACVEYRIELADATIDFLTRLVIPSTEARSDPCDLLPSAIEQVTGFVRNSQRTDG